ncbi:MAG: glycosyltransferase [Armatimonadota bacterium]
MQSEPIECKRILIIKLSSIGDVVMATPVAKALRNAYPNAYIAWAVEAKSRDVLVGNPYLDEVIVLDRKWSTSSGITEAAGTLAGMAKSSHVIKAGKFDTAIDLQGLLRSALVGMISGAKHRLGYDSAGECAPLFYNMRLKTRGNKTRGPQDYLDLLQLLGIKTDDIDMHIPISDGDRRHVDDLIGSFTDGVSAHSIAALCPSTTWPQKHWTEHGWAELADALTDRYGMLPVFLGSQADNPFIERIRGMMKYHAASAAGKTTLNQATALLDRSDFVVAVDTGLLHMAVGLDKPTVGIFGPTSWRHLAKKPSFKVVVKTCPYMPCLRHPVCKLFDCMQAISAEDIISTAGSFLPQISDDVSRSQYVTVPCNTAVNIPDDNAVQLKLLKTLHIETGMHSLGGPAQVIYLLKGLKKRGHGAILVCPTRSSIYKQALSAGLDVLPVSFNTDVDISFVFKLYKIIKKMKPDIVHLHSRRGADILGGIAARLAGVPGIVLSRRIDNPVRPGLVSHLKYCILCNKIIAISNGVYDALIQGGVDKDKVVCVRSAVDSPVYMVDRKPGLRTELGIPDGALVLGIIAQLIERKGHRYLLDAMPNILARFPQTVLLILGQGQMQSKIEEQVKSLGIEKNVIFGGFRNDIPYVLQELDLLVHPAMMEGLGVAILQAMSAGLPVVASGVGGIPEAVRDGINGITVPPADTKALEDAIIKLLGDPVLRKEMGDVGRRIVVDEFSVECMVDGVLDVYRDILNPDTSKPSSD